MKRYVTRFLKNHDKDYERNQLVYDKRHFVPYKDERDQLGRIINSVNLIG